MVWLIWLIVLISLFELNVTFQHIHTELPLLHMMMSTVKNIKFVAQYYCSITKPLHHNHNIIYDSILVFIFISTYMCKRYLEHTAFSPKKVFNISKHMYLVQIESMMFVPSSSQIWGINSESCWGPSSLRPLTSKTPYIFA